jgi:hypothetical protein
VKLSTKFRERWFQVGSWAATEWDQLIASMRGSWLVEHTEDDGHSNITVYSVTERGRAVAMGVWQTQAFDAGNFTAIATMTWTVVVGNQITFRYMTVGKTLFVNAYIDATTVGGVLNTELRLTIPGGFTAAQKVQTSCPLFDNGVGATGYARVLVGSRTIDIGRMDGANWTASAANTFVRVMMAFEFQ